MAVKEKWAQGGSLGPVVGGEDHLPVEGEVTHVLIVELLTSLQQIDQAETCFFL